MTCPASVSPITPRIVTERRYNRSSPAIHFCVVLNLLEAPPSGSSPWDVRGRGLLWGVQKGCLPPPSKDSEGFLEKHAQKEELGREPLGLMELHVNLRDNTYL